MARIRSIHPSACTSEKLARASAEAERCYWRLQTHCDDEGRCEDHPRLLWAALFPLHETVVPADVHAWLGELETVGLIRRYEVDGRRYLCVIGWAEKQSPRHPTPSKCPEPPEGYGGSPQGNHQTPEGYGNPPHEKEKEVGEGGARKRATSPPKDFAPTDSHQAYATEHRLDLDGEKARWLAHCEAKGTTYKSINAGFTTWLHHAVDFGRGKKPEPVIAPAPAIEPPLSLVPDPPERCSECRKLKIDCVCAIDRTVQPRFKASMGAKP